MGIGYNFTDSVRKALQLAREEALRLQHGFVAPEHILCALLRDPDQTVKSIVESSGKSPAALLEILQGQLQPGEHLTPSDEHLPYSITAKRVLERAMIEAQELQSTEIGTGHLLLGMLRQPLGLSTETLEQAGVELAKARAVVAQRNLSSGGPADRVWFLSRPSLSQVPILGAFVLAVGVVGVLHAVAGNPPGWTPAEALAATVAAAVAQVTGGIYLYFRRANQVLVVLALTYVLAIVAWRMAR